MKSFIFYISNNGFPRYLYIILSVLLRIVKDFLGKNYCFVTFLSKNLLSVLTLTLEVLQSTVWYIKAGPIHL